MTASTLDGRALLRHFLATLAYRAGKTLQGAPASYADHDTGGGWTPLKILTHMGTLIEWTLAKASADPAWKAGAPGTWDEEVVRFHGALAKLDAFLVSDADFQIEVNRLLQGPLADAMTHVGQLAMLRRMVGAPIAGENYLKADIAAGRVGPEQHYPA